MGLKTIPRQVFLLGAGASRHAGYPLVNDFIEKFNDKFKSTTTNKNNPIGSYSSVLMNFRNKILPDGNIEELLTLAEFLENVQYADLSDLIMTFDNIPRWYIIPGIKMAILFLLAELDKEKSHSDVYEAFVQKYNGTFITLNWDCLLDYALLSVKNLRWPECNKESMQKSVKSFPTVFLKLHGSADRIWCPNWQCGYFEKKKPSEILETLLGNETGCPKCGGETKHEHGVISYSLEPFIVGPSLYKGRNIQELPFITEQWCFAHNALQEADELIFIGYSLPRTDFHLESLLRVSLFKRNVRPLLVRVVNNGDIKPLIARYLEVFTDDSKVESETQFKYKGSRYGADISIEFIPKSFEDFVANLS